LPSYSSPHHLPHPGSSATYHPSARLQTPHVPLQSHSHSSLSRNQNSTPTMHHGSICSQPAVRPPRRVQQSQG
ncbi:hypothetical protein C0993_006565, partial [Termitomyces sp. T159_Od127]